MKIAYISANREKLPEPVVPLGLLYVIQSTPEKHDKKLLDMCFSRAPMKHLEDFLDDYQPDFIAVGLRNLQNADYSGIHSNLDYYQELIQTIRKKTHVPVVLGGGGFSVAPEQVMKTLKPDFGITGEGEVSFRKLLEVVEKGSKDYATVPSLNYFADGELKSNPVMPAFLDVNEMSFLPRHMVSDQYYKKTGIESIQTKRGCVLKCTYCSYPKIEGRSYRMKEPKLVVDEMFDALEKNPDIKHFFFVDSVFNLPKQYAKKVCRELIERKWKTPWTCYANPIGFDQEGANLLKEAGCEGVEIGSDSGCDDVLKSLKKGFTTKQIFAASKMAREAGVKDCHTFILGTMGETMDHVKRSLDFIVELDPYAAIIMAWMDDNSFFDPELEKQRKILRENTLKMLSDMKDQFPRWIIPPLQVNFDPMKSRYLKLKGYHGPSWQHIKLIPDVIRSDSSLPDIPEFSELSN